jgi:hypothetical protein
MRQSAELFVEREGIAGSSVPISSFKRRAMPEDDCSVRRFHVRGPRCGTHGLTPDAVPFAKPTRVFEAKDGLQISRGLEHG